MASTTKEASLQRNWREDFLTTGAALVEANMTPF
jgi:hypothetical protein